MYIALTMNPFAFLQVILLCACGADEELPSTPDLPADLFTCCLTSPMRVALEFAARDALVCLRSFVQTIYCL